MCTNEPPCPMHDESLREVLAAGRPAVFTVATPRFCRSRLCGPVVEEVLLAREKWADRVDFVHAEVYTDDEASPPEWVDLLKEVRNRAIAVRATVTNETVRFVDEPDIRRALARRERVAAALRDDIAKINDRTRRLNLIAPNARFTRGTLDADETLRPLFRTVRRAGGYESG